ncbi:MAG: hypothetical protein ACAI44_15795 [Candidatus Sericytochromatia bacterium]
MNASIKQASYFALTLLLASVLGGCPPEPGHNQPSGEPPSGPPLTQLTTFPSQHLQCCWQALEKVEPSYPQLALAALNGQPEALEKLLLLAKKLELTAGYTHGAVLAEVLTRVGDARFAFVLQKLDSQGALKDTHSLFPETLKENLRNLLEGGFSLNLDPAVHMQKMGAFSTSAKLLDYVVEAKKG